MTTQDREAILARARELAEQAPPLTDEQRSSLTTWLSPAFAELRDEQVRRAA
jgi:DNA-directed RNA polymerase subunit K/omega